MYFEIWWEEQMYVVCEEYGLIIKEEYLVREWNKKFRKERIENASE